MLTSTDPARALAAEKTSELHDQKAAVNSAHISPT
jgi:hypothetical protein